MKEGGSECCSPVPLQAVSRSLIMWDEVEPTQEWIDAHIPAVREGRRGRLAILFDSCSFPSQTVQELAFQGDQKIRKDDPSIDYQTFR